MIFSNIDQKTRKQILIVLFCLMIFNILQLIQQINNGIYCYEYYNNSEKELKCYHNKTIRDIELVEYNKWQLEQEKINNPYYNIGYDLINYSLNSTYLNFSG